MGTALGVPDVAIVLDPGSDAAREGGVLLDLGDGREALLVLGAGAGDDVFARVRERVAPALEALLRAALDRDRLQAEVVETQALRRSDVIKTALLRAVSHDLRTPLTAIITAGHAVRSPELEDGERDELGLVVVEEAQRLSALVDKLLDLSRLQAGAAEPRRDWCSLEEVVRTAAIDVGAGTRAASRSPSTRTSRWCRPMPPSSSACSSTCSRTRGATAAATRSRSVHGSSAAR